MTPTRRQLFSSAAITLAGAATSAASADAIPPRPGGPRLKVGLAAYCYRKYLQAKSDRMTYTQFLDEAAKMNVDGVELTSYYWPDPLTRTEINRVTRHAFLLGLEVTGSATANNFALPPGPERDKEIAYVKKWLAHTADMGGRELRIFAGSPPKGADDAQGRKWVIECLQECIPTAEEHGVILAMENHHGVVKGPEGVIEILEGAASPWLGAKWDGGNFRTPDPYADLEKIVKYAVTTHVKTELFHPDGTKYPADLARILSILKKGGYRGYVLLEYEAEEEPKLAVPHVVAELQRLANA